MATHVDVTAAEVVADALLTVRGLRAGYGAREVVYGVDLDVRFGEMVTLLGHNGAGKTTTLRSIFGLQRPTAGTIVCADGDLTDCTPLDSISAGVSFTPADRFVFGDLAVHENLALGALRVPGAEVGPRLQRVFALFPILKERSAQLAGTMSGGQQRMLSLGMALMTKPRLMILDEPSLGLSPLLADQVMDTLRRLVDEDGVSVLLVEQNIAQALRHSDRAYVMRAGEIILATSAADLRARGSWWDLF